MSPLTDAEIIDIDFFAGDMDDGSEPIRCHTVKIVKTRRDQMCVAFEETHVIPKGSRARVERAVYEGEWKSWYACIPCCERWEEELCGPPCEDCERGECDCFGDES